MKAIEEINNLNLGKANEESGIISPIKRDANASLKEANMKNVAKSVKTKKPSNKPKGKYSKGILTPAELERLFLILNFKFFD